MTISLGKVEIGMINAGTSSFTKRMVLYTDPRDLEAAIKTQILASMDPSSKALEQGKLKTLN